MDLLVLVMFLAVLPVTIAGVYLVIFTMFWTELRRAARMSNSV